MTINQFIRIIQGLRSDEPCIDPSKWHTTQKEHWLGWLGEYHGPGAYGRKTNVKRDVRYAYNHIVESKMLLWLIEAAGVKNGAYHLCSAGLQGSFLSPAEIRGDTKTHSLG